MPRGRRKASAQRLSGMSEPHRIRFYTRSSSRNGDLHSRMRFRTVHCLQSSFFVVYHLLRNAESSHLFCDDIPARALWLATIRQIISSALRRYLQPKHSAAAVSQDHWLQSAFPLSIRCRASAAEADPVLARAAAPGRCLIRMCGASGDFAAHLSARRIFFRDSISGVFVARCQVYIG